MNKKNLAKLTTVVALLASGAYISCSNQTVSAASWGAKTLFTTPKATRGTWYYKENGKIKRWKITAHTSKGRKLYKVLPEKEYTKWWNKLVHQNTKKHYKTINKLDSSQWQAYTFKWHGTTSFNTNGWLAGAGDGIYYVPVTKTRYGRKVSALRFGGGAAGHDHERRRHGHRALHRRHAGEH